MINVAYAEYFQWPSLFADWLPDQIDDVSSVYIPFRSVGRARVRCDVNINSFCKMHLHAESWTELFLWGKSALHEIENDFISFCGHIC